MIVSFCSCDFRPSGTLNTIPACWVCAYCILIEHDMVGGGARRVEHSGWGQWSEMPQAEPWASSTDLGINGQDVLVLITLEM